TLARLLPYQIPEKLKPVRSRLVEFSANETYADLRQSAWAALALADDSFDLVWDKAAHSAPALPDLLTGIPLLPDPSFRAKAYDRVKPLLSAENSAPTSVGVRRAAIRALTSMNYEPEKVFSTLADLIIKGREVPAAAQG